MVESDSWNVRNWVSTSNGVPRNFSFLLRVGLCNTNSTGKKKKDSLLCKPLIFLFLFFFIKVKILLQRKEKQKNTIKSKRNKKATGKSERTCQAIPIGKSERTYQAIPTDTPSLASASAMPLASHST